ncbi:MAG: ABC transporter permease [Fimbriimonadaceae bacterium]|nr:ABC transporter permease [Fimbriimonadaceae bacterium]
MAKQVGLFQPINNVAMGVFTFVGECTLIVWEAARRIFRRPAEIVETINQMAFIGVASVPIVALTTFFSGAVLALYSSEFLLKYGASQFVGSAVGLAVTREIAPVLAGIMVAARCGSAMAAQIGSMNVTEQIDALRMLSVNPSNYLVLPRMIAAAVMLPILCMVGVYSGVLGGMLVAQASGVPGGLFLNSMQQFVTPWDFVGGLIKAPIFGLIIAVVACQQGMRTSNGAVGVGRATTNTVVISMVLVYVANYILAQILY